MMTIHTACKFCLQWNVQRFYISVWNLLSKTMMLELFKSAGWYLPWANMPKEFSLFTYSVVLPQFPVYTWLPSTTLHPQNYLSSKSDKEKQVNQKSRSI